MNEKKLNDLKILSYQLFLKKANKIMFHNIDHVKKLNPICENRNIQKEVQKALNKVF